LVNPATGDVRIGAAGAVMSTAGASGDTVDPPPHADNISAQKHVKISGLEHLMTFSSPSLTTD